MKELAELAEKIDRLSGVLRHAARQAAPKSVPQAVLALGLTEARILSILHVVRMHFFTSTAHFDTDPQTILNLRRGVICAHLAQARDDLDPVDAFVLGMFSDLGSLMLAQRLPHLATSIEAIQGHPGKARREAELLMTGHDHITELLESPIGALLTEPFREAIAAHHEPDHPLARLIWTTDVIADVSQVGDRVREIAEQAMWDLGWAGTLTELLEATEARMKQLAAPIRLSLTTYEPRRAKTSEDSLSGLSNQHSFSRELGTLLERTRRMKQQISIILINVDSFQLINEFYGNPAGDQLLRDIAAQIKRCTRLTDQLGRLGGDAFCLALPKSSVTGGQVVAERIRATVERTEVLMGDVRAGCSISLCGTTVPYDSTSSAEELLESLQRSLDDVRQKGRNRVSWMGPQGTP
jgi:diguanylate cyclase (GGDEF)-like protein